MWGKTLRERIVKTTSSSGGCSPVNWLSQSRTNLATEYLNLNFEPHFITFYAEKVFISCVWLFTISRVRTMSKPFLYRYFKVFNQVGNRQYFQLVGKKMICRRTCKESSWRSANWLIRHRNQCCSTLLWLPENFSAKATCRIWRSV